MIYEFITPSDPITFKAENDKVAFMCALVLGNGKAGCVNTETGESMPTMLLFTSDPADSINKFLGCSLEEFHEENRGAIISAFKSFAYGSAEDRKTYDEAIEAITDPEKLEKFKSQHEDRNRTSLNKWVKAAWKMAERIRPVAA